MNEELSLMNHTNNGEHDWAYTGYDEYRGVIYERHYCSFVGCSARDYRRIED